MNSVHTSPTYLSVIADAFYWKVLCGTQYLSEETEAHFNLYNSLMFY